VGDCEKLTTVSGVSGTAKIAKATAPYKTGYTVTLGEATIGTAYSCYHLFTANFETVVNTPASSSDSTSDLIMNYYDAQLVNKTCMAPVNLGTPTS